MIRLSIAVLISAAFVAAMMAIIGIVFLANAGSEAVCGPVIGPPVSMAVLVGIFVFTLVYLAIGDV